MPFHRNVFGEGVTLLDGFDASKYSLVITPISLLYQKRRQRSK